MGDEDTPGEWSDEQRREFRRALDERRRRTAVGGQLFAGLLVALVAAGVLLRLPAASDLVRPVVELLPVEMMTLALAALDGREAGTFHVGGKVTTTE